MFKVMFSFMGPDSFGCRSVFHVLQVVRLALIGVLMFCAPPLLAAEPQLITPADPYQSFGEDVDINGDLMVISEPGVETVHVFERVDGVWQEFAALATSQDTDTSSFGVDIAVDGNVVAVGAPRDEVNGLSEAGAVYVFERDDAGTWAEVARLVAPVPVTTTQFGSSLELDGGRIIVATSRFREVDDAAYLFERDASGAWNHARTFAGEDGSALIADDVSIFGDTVAIARDGYGVFLYAHGEAGWLLEQFLDVSEGNTQRMQLSLEGGTLVIGLPDQDLEACCPRSEGKVLIYARLDNGWTQTAALQSPQPFANIGFGNNVHLQDGLLAVDENYETTRTFAYRPDENGEWQLFFEDMLGIGMENGPYNRSAISAHTFAIVQRADGDGIAQVKAWSIADILPPDDDEPGDDGGGNDDPGDDAGNVGDGDDPADDAGDGGNADGGDDGNGDGDSDGGDDGGNDDTAGGGAGGDSMADETADAQESDSGGGAVTLLLAVLASLAGMRRRAKEAGVA